MFFVSLPTRKRQSNMEQTKYVAYYRVSTSKQDLGIESQREIVSQWINSHGGSLIASFSEKESGKRNDRPELEKALAECKRHSAKLLIAKLDRLSRNIAFIFELKESGVEFQSCDLPDFNTLTLGIFATMAQYERELISNRTKAALALLKEKGVKLGKPNATFTEEMRSKALSQRKQNARSNEANKKAFAAIKFAVESGTMTLNALAAYLNDNGFKTANDGIWRGNQVKRLIETMQSEET